VYNFGECEQDTFVVVKDTPYRMDQFLFGIQEDSKAKFTRISDEVRTRGNRLKFILFYLSPADYHRYHSPALWTTDFRRHMAGKLLPVKPTYVANHQNVFKENERVSLCGEWANGFFSQTFIGATNVGSIVVNFDTSLKTNIMSHQGNEVLDKEYTSSEFSSRELKKSCTEVLPEVKNDVITAEYAPGSFERKDTLINDQPEAEITESFLSNGDSSIKSEETKDSSRSVNAEHCYLKSYLNQREEFLTVEAENQEYPLTPKGFLLTKGQEVGFFNLGSSIMLIFEAPEKAEFEVKVGQKVTLGKNILSANILE